MAPWKVPQTAHAYQPVIDRALAYIDEHLADEISLEQVARAALLSPFHFHRIFAARLGETPNQYINRLRLERAANLLIKNREASITEIAFASGFTSSAVFARSFKEHFGIPASQFRILKGEAFKGLIERSRQAGESPGPAVADGLAWDVQVRQLPQRLVAYVANLEGYSLPKICAAWNRLFRWARQHGIMDEHTLVIGISFDDPFITPHNRCRYYACITIPQRPSPQERVSYMELNGGMYAVCRVACHAERIADVYHALYGAWLPDSGYLPGDMPTYEVYYQTPETHPEGKYLLEICLPVQ